MTLAEVDRLVHPSDLPAVRALRQPEAAGRRFEIEFRLRAGGGERWLISVGEMRLDAQGTLADGVGVLYDITERKAEERRRYAGDSFLRGFLNNAHSYLFAKDLEGRYILANRYYLDAFGYETEADLCGLTDKDRFGAEDVYTQNDRRVLAEGQAITFEEIAVSKDGSRIHALSTKFPLRDERRRIFAVGCVSTDVTERLEAAAALEISERRLGETEAKLKRLFADAPAMIAQHEGPEHRYIFSNAMHDRAVGNRRLIGLTLREAMPELADQNVFERFDRVFQTGEPIHIPEFEAVFDRNGSGETDAGWYRQVLQPWFDADGAVAGVMSFAFDITEQVTARRHLRRSETRLKRERLFLREVIENAPIGISIAQDPERGEPILNEAARRMTGVSDFSGDLTRYKVMGAVHPDGRPYKVGDYPTVCALTRGEAVSREQMIYETDRERRRWLVNSKPLRDDDGTIIAAVTSMWDVEDLLRAQELRDLLIAELNHRVKNTLAVVQSLARRSFLAAPDKDTAVQMFGGRLQALAAAHDLLSQKNWQEADLGALVARTVSVVADPAGRVDIAGPPLRLAIERTVTIALAFHELATNAVKYGALSAGDGRVTVRWEVIEDDTARLVMTWREHGGPPVAAPVSRGFGMTMIERALAFELNAQVHLDFAPDGFACTFEAPVQTAKGGDHPWL